MKYGVFMRDHGIHPFIYGFKLYSVDEHGSFTYENGDTLPTVDEDGLVIEIEST